MCFDRPLVTDYCSIDHGLCIHDTQACVYMTLGRHDKRRDSYMCTLQQEGHGMWYACTGTLYKSLLQFTCPQFCYSGLSAVTLVLQYTTSEQSWSLAI